MEHLNRNLHAKLQEMCDCYMDTDYLPELDKAAAYKGNDLEENSIKYLALAILEALTQKAEKLSVKKKNGVKVTVTAHDGKTTLAPPSVEMADKIFEIIRTITHIEEAKGELLLAFGLRNSQMDLTVKIKKNKDGESLKFVFPDLEPR